MRYSSSTWLFGALLVVAASCGSDDGGGGSNPTGGAGGGTSNPAGSTSVSGMSSVAGSQSVAGAMNTGGSTTGGTSNMPGAGGDDTGVGGEPMMPGGKAFGCPEAKPAEGGECTRPAPTACEYDDGGCLCVEGAWDCYADADCPAAAPADAETCSLGGMACTYENDLSCTCSTMNGWSCVTPCPEATPADGASCRRPEERTCRYAEGAVVQGGFGKADTTCACGDDGQFNCFSDADCPAAAPANESACDMATLRCEYDDRNCTCNDGAWTCQTDCPEAEPTDGAECLRPANASCRYLEGAPVQGFGEADSTCVCEEGTFTCFGAEDCPTAAPTTGGACEFASLSCEYTGLQCNCGQDDTWSCTTECPAAPPTQGAACERSEQMACRYNDGALASGFGGSAEAICTCREQAFDCLTEANCPAAAPADDAECADLVGLACSYADQRCTCGQNGWSCQTECPAQPPTAGATCDRPVTSACGYTGGALVEAGGEAESTCVCSNNAFLCYSNADCPATQPESMVECDKPGLECDYEGTSCRCRTSTSAWSCMEAPMMGAGGAAQ